MSVHTQSAPRSALRRVLVLLPALLFALLAAIFLLRLYGGDPAVLPSALIGKPVPEFNLPPIEGLSESGVPVPAFSNTDLTKGNITLVNFWASWCPPCRAEHPILMELGKRQDLELVGINQKDKAENARRFLGLHGNPFAKVGADPRGRVSIDWGVYGLPETFIIDAEGRIRFKHVGPLTQDILPQFQAEIEAARKPVR